MKVSSFKQGEIYGIETGDFAGQMFVVVDIADEYIGCLKLPDMGNIKVPVDSFERGRNTGIITLSEKLPRSVYKISKAQYYKNEDSNN
jgi:hypothetical protein